MGLSQALSAALSGVTATQQALSVISGNVANANTPGYIVENVNLIAVATTGQQGVSVDTTGINRNLNTLLQNQLWTETSGASYADTASQMYQQLQQVYGAPSSSSSFSAIYSNFTTAVQALSTSPGSYSAQTQVIGSAQVLAQSLNAMTGTIQGLRTQAEQGISADVATANNAIADIAKINQQLGAAPADSATAMLEDQRDQDVAQLSKLMNVTIVRGANNQMSVYSGTGQQLVSGVNASTLSFDNVGTMTPNALWSANPSQDQAGTITVTTTSGAKTDLIAEGAIQSGEIGAYLQMRDSILPQAQNQLDELANQMSQALSNQTTNGAVATSGSQSGYSVDVGSVLPGNTVQLTYTDSSSIQHTVTLVALGPGGTLPANTSSSANNRVIGVNFSGGMSSVVAQLNAVLGTSVQFSNPSGTLLQAVNRNASTSVNSLSETTTATGFMSGSAQLPMFLDGTQPITGALTSAGSQTTGLAGRITVNPALLASPANLISYASNTAAGDPTRPNFVLNQLNNAMLTFSPDTGIGSTAAPYSGTLTNYMSALISQQSQAANAASNLQQGQDTVLSALQQRFNDQSGVNIDTEMSNLIALQNAYGANARVMTTIQQMMATLLQSVSG
jgi:flagellar hook-associated protein 1 FlgK